jgi:ABC-type transport system involved in multi-copper enzyme maturation permease subunit
MLPGPVFAFELLTTARRGRFYLARALYAVVLLLILWAIFSAWSSEYQGELPWHRVQWLGLSAFGGISIGQELLVLALTPALVAGVIADEKRRKTLHYLMASRLTGAEIVLGKLLVRMLYIGVLLGVSLPVLSLLVLLSGIDPRLILLSCASTLTTAWFLAALATWSSAIARRPREALVLAYGLEGLWLVVPALLAWKGTTGWPAIDGPVLGLAAWVGASSPVELYGGALYGVGFRGGQAWDQEVLAWMLGLQLAYGAALAALAAAQLRPIFRRQEGAASRRRGLRAMMASIGGREHPPLGDRPMIWKELHTGGTRGLARFIGFVLTLISGGFLAYYAFCYGALALWECWDRGYPPMTDLRGLNGQLSWSWTQGTHRGKFYDFLRGTLPLVYLVFIVRVAATAAASITSEHEEDTWVSLTATDLTGREILLAKLLGALRRGFKVAEVLFWLAVVGAIAGSLHPLSPPALVLALVVFGWLAAALGVWISIQLRSTWRAQFLALSCLILLNIAGQGLLNTLSPRGFAPQVWPGFTPYEIAKLVMDPAFFYDSSLLTWPYFWRLWEVDDGRAWGVIFTIMSLVGSAALAALLTWDGLRRFAIVAGRARRPRRPNPAGAAPVRPPHAPRSAALQGTTD